MSKKSLGIAAALALSVCLPSVAMERLPCAGISVFQWTIQDLAKERGISVAQAAELFKSIGVSGFDCGYDDACLTEIASTGLKPINLFGTVLFRAPDRGEAQIRDFLAAAVRYRVPRVMVIPDAFTDGKPNEPEFQAVVDGYRRFVAAAGKVGVTVTAETFGNQKNPCSYAAYVKRLLDEVPGLCFALDTGNLHFAGRGDDILDMAHYASNRIAHVHLKDWKKGLPPVGPKGVRNYETIGLGVIPNEELVRYAHAIGFRGWYTLEHPLPGDTLGDTVRQIAVLKHWLLPPSSVCDSVSAAPGEVSWRFPIDHSCHEGLAFSDATTGVLVWGGGRTICLTVGRGDLWDHRGGYVWKPEQSYSNIVAGVERDDIPYLEGLFARTPAPGEPKNPRLLPLGRVEIELDEQAELISGALDPKTGLGRLTYALNGQMNVVKLAMSRERGAFVLSFPEGTRRTMRILPSMTQPRVAAELRPLGFDDAEMTPDGFTWKLPSDPSVSLFATEKGGEVLVSTGRGECRPVEADYASVEADSRAQWQAFWTEGARVCLPDATLQRVYDYGMYRYGAMTDPHGVPAGLQGPWLEDDRMIPWCGDYHFNINVQECYSPSFRGGHFGNILPLFRMILSWRPRLRENARLFCGIDNGYVLPHSVDDRGVCIGGFWIGTIDHGSTAWMASQMFRYVRYTRDLAFLKDGAYDFMCGAMRVYLAMLRRENGKLVLPVGTSPEWGGARPKEAIGRNSSFQLAAMHRLAADLDEAEKLLGVADGASWKSRIKDLPLFSKGKCGIALWEGQDYSYTHRHHSHMAGLYPFDVIDLEQNRTLVNNTYFNWADRGTSSWAGWSHPWASILQTHIGNADAAQWALALWDRFFCNRGHGSRHDAYRPGFSVMRRGKNARQQGVCGDVKGEEIMQMDGQCAAVTAILEMMVHDVNGRTHYFRGCPEDWLDVSFENVATADGRRVNGRRVNGKIEIW